MSKKFEVIFSKKIKKLLIIIFFILILSAAGILVVFFTENQIAGQLPIRDNNHGGSMHGMGANVLITDPTERQLVVSVQNIDPLAAFAQLQQLMTNDPQVTNRCHMLVHIIGEAAFNKYGSFKDAIPFDNELCGSGYVHALIVKTLDASTDPTNIIKSICLGRDGFCYHGIGHGLMFFTKNDVPHSLDYCATLDSDERRGRCSEGVFMQNFETSKMQMYATAYLYAADPLKLCRETANFKLACYHYAGSFLARESSSTQNFFDLCKQSERGYVGKCVSGMGAYILTANLANIKKAESICTSASDVVTQVACIDGMVSYHLTTYNSVEKTREFCASLEVKNQSACEAALLVRKAYYQYK